jgi:hypothetical protein
MPGPSKGTYVMVAGKMIYVDSTLVRFANFGIDIHLLKN